VQRWWVLYRLAELAVVLADRERAAIAYEPLRVAGHLCFVAADIVAIGSVAHTLGNLAASIGRLDEAERHFEAALAMGERMRARPWIARTQHDFARMLLARGAGDDLPANRRTALPCLPSP
jgi:hypothetical protein